MINELMGLASLYGGIQSMNASNQAAGASNNYYNAAANNLDTQTKIANDLWNRFQTHYAPLEDTMIQEASQSPQYNKYVGQAVSDTRQAYKNADTTQRMDAQRYGLNPNSGRFASMEKQNALDQARTQVGAMDEARQQAQDKQWAKQLVMAQLGRGLPASAESALSSASSGYTGIGNSYGNEAIAAGKGASAGFTSAGYWAGKALDQNPPATTPEATGAQPTWVGNSGVDYGLPGTYTAGIDTSKL